MRPAREARQAWIRALEAVSRMHREPDLTLPILVEAVGREHAERPALLGADEDFDFIGLAERMGRVARWASARCPGQTVGLLLPNRPALVSLWLGLTRAGCAAALLNPNLAGPARAHAVKAAHCTLVIADDDLLDGLDLPGPVMAVSALWAELPDQNGAPSPAPDPNSTALLIFTSGTTGLPKAARVSHGRVLEWALWFGALLDLGPDDRIYDCLPLYHSTGGVVAIGAALSRGASVLVAPGFRASRFWDDVIDGGCTVFFYIGELCRYVLGNPPPDRPHRLRLACGNGLQAVVWDTFQKRFGIPEILEFYAATEGNVSLYNCEGLPGAIGRVPPFLRQRFPLALVQLDEHGHPLRRQDGRCLPAAVGQPGEAIGRIDRAGGPARRFEGYTDAVASAAKVVSDVFEPGDRWFRSGDLMRMDAAGFLFFVDRLGDTFRWKGENVSTTEVAAVLRTCPGVMDAAVYGVPVFGNEGKAGMAAVVVGPDFNMTVLWSHAAAQLPSYARPVFVRQRSTLVLTGTFKLPIAALASEGFAGLADLVWVADRKLGRYVVLDATIEAAIACGKIRF